MLQTRRSALKLGRRTVKHQTRRYGSSSPSVSDHAGPSHHLEPVNEPMGKGFWIALTAIPLSFAVYKFSHNSSDSNTPPFFTRLIDSYSQSKEKWTERNTLHTNMIEQAAFDRNLFQSAPGSKMVDLKFPEVFNTGSPYNVPAGHGVNLGALIAHYEQKNRESEAKRAERLSEVKMAEKLSKPDSLTSM